MVAAAITISVVIAELFRLHPYQIKSLHFITTIILVGNTHFIPITSMEGNVEACPYDCLSHRNPILSLPID